jgi:RNA recognition motif-containing protein
LANKLYVGNLSYSTSEDDIRDFFAAAGNVASVNIITDKFDGRSKGFGFVEMATEAEAKTAIEELNGKSLGDRTITVQEARPQENRGGGSYGDRRSTGGRSGGGYGSRGSRW